MAIPGTVRYTAQMDMEIAHQRVIQAIESATRAFGPTTDIVHTLTDAAIALNKAMNHARDI